MTLTRAAVRDLTASIRLNEPSTLLGQGPAELEELANRLELLSNEERAGLDEAIDDVQIASKLWLIDELAKVREVESSRMVVLGSWYGILPLLLNWRLASPPASMLCLDIDPAPIHAGERLIAPLFSNIEYRVGDAMTFDYSGFAREGDSIVVNTVCEHLPRFEDWWAAIPRGQFVVLQSNDYFICPDHVNAVKDLEEMKAQAPMSQVHFEGALPIMKWRRFMLIGTK